MLEGNTTLSHGLMAQKQFLSVGSRFSEYILPDNCFTVKVDIVKV